MRTTGLQLRRNVPLQFDNTPAVAGRIDTVAVDVVTIGIVLSPSPATGAQNKSIRWLGVSPIPEAVEPTRPVRSMKHIVVHQYPTGADMRRQT
jgi:hypothetical protein